MQEERSCGRIQVYVGSLTNYSRPLRLLGVLTKLWGVPWTWYRSRYGQYLCLLCGQRTYELTYPLRTRRDTKIWLSGSLFSGVRVSVCLTSLCFWRSSPHKFSLLLIGCSSDDKEAKQWCFEHQLLALSKRFLSLPRTSSCRQTTNDKKEKLLAIHSPFHTCNFWSYYSLWKKRTMKSYFGILLIAIMVCLQAVCGFTPLTTTKITASTTTTRLNFGPFGKPKDDGSPGDYVCKVRQKE